MSRPKSTHLDELDARLIGLLEENPRGSNSSFARELGVSEKTIRVRMERLFSEFDMRIEVSVRDRPRTAARMLYVLSCKVADRFRILNRLTAEAAVQYGYAVTGGAEIALLAGFDDDAEAFKFQHDILEPLDDVEMVLALRLMSEVSSGASSRAMPLIDPKALNAALLRNTAEMDVQELLAWLSHELVSVFGADRSMAGAFGEPGSVKLAHRLWHNFPPYYAPQILKLSEPDRSPGTINSVAQTQRVVYVRDAQESKMFDWARTLIKRVGYRTVVSFPLKYGDSLVGVATLYFDEIRELDDSYTATVQSFLDQVALRLHLALGA
ncbi:AsnC family transcriptional regulator [Brevibacterium sp.]|jgi:DNA-binding Lrp family transcriptional regulator|uniref:AsnC family transcriptional regulator n=1 Tax=Brevibacterium sp. TaxID=1701 RepID=UPI0025C3F290|nr:AsnC family transcriptional regulator [Brevibacterium sp.]